MLTQQRLREILHYDPATGVFTFAKGRRKGKVTGTRHDGRGFLKVSIDNERHLLHRLAWLWMTGTMPRWRIDHINGNHSDNRWSNLCEGDRMQKRQHCAPRRELTGVPGVWRVGGRFEAMVEVEGTTVNLGAFSTAEEAGVATAQVHRRAREREARSHQRAA